jgi:YHS domain-containing protein
MRRVFLLILVVVAVFWWVGRLFAALRKQQSIPRGQGHTVAPPTEGTMVRDRVCNTFLPRSRALSAHVGQEEHFFCSERCKQKFLARQTG